MPIGDAFRTGKLPGRVYYDMAKQRGYRSQLSVTPTQMRRLAVGKRRLATFVSCFAFVQQRHHGLPQGLGTCGDQVSLPACETRP